MTIDHGDGLPDGRVTCGMCRHCSGNRCSALRMLTWADLPLRCLAFVPRAGDADQRTGRERWPTLKRDTEEARALDEMRRTSQGDNNDERSFQPSPA